MAISSVTKRQSKKLEKTNPTVPEKATLTVEEAAKIIGLARGSAYEAVRNGELPSIRFGRRIFVPRAALEQMLTNHNVKAR